MKKYLMIGFAAVAFAACSNHDFETYSPEQVVKAEYDAKFISEFGKPGPQQNWGFGASTRAFTRTYNVNGNLWHKAKPEGFDLEYDAPVTAAEKNMVFNYVNNAAHVEKVDQISFTQYWVAQIWNGANDANAQGVKAPVSTSYRDQNGATTTTVGGAHMDKLDILEKAGTWTHCNNFNDADNNDWIEAAETGGVEGRTLMWESGTLSFRYINSDGSHMSEKYIIVPGEKIDASLKGFYYVCFDFEKGYTAEEEANERSYGTCEKWIVQEGNPAGGYWQSENWNLPGFYKDANSTELINTLKTNLGTDVRNITFNGYLYGQQHFDGDDNYTDWIVRISPAKERYDGRIMAEDLTVQSSSDWDFNDVVFDFKFINGTANILLQAAGGTLPLCIGGSVDANGNPILDEDGNVKDGKEVHALFGYTNSYPMINTGAGPEKSAVKVELTDKSYSQASDILISVKKKVNGEDKWIAITAFQGEPAAKFVTYTTVNWVDEFANIKGAYTDFIEYVENGSGYFNPDPEKKNGLYFDRIMRNE